MYKPGGCFSVQFAFNINFSFFNENQIIAVSAKVTHTRHIQSRLYFVLFEAASEVISILHLSTTSTKEF